MEELDFDDMPLVNLHIILEEFAKEVISVYRDNLNTNGHIASGQLFNNLDFEINSSSVNISVSLHIADYFRYLEEGRGPTKSSGPGEVRENILNWIRVKGITPLPDEKGKIPTEEQLAFLIARKIHREGYKGTNDLKHAIDEVFSRYETQLREALEKDFDDFSMKILDKVDKMIAI